MDYYFTTTLSGLTFEQAIEEVTQALKKEGFGVLTKIDIKATLKKKLNVDFHDYIILGACNPPFAHQALLSEDKIGTMLPCNVIVQQRKPGSIEVAAVDPIASMSSVENESLGEIATQVQDKLRSVILSLS